MIAGSPLLAAMPGLTLQSLQDYVIADPSEAINVLDFEAAARKALPPAHWGYLTTGVDDEASLRANRGGSLTTNYARGGWSMSARST